MLNSKSQDQPSDEAEITRCPSLETGKQSLQVRRTVSTKNDDTKRCIQCSHHQHHHRKQNRKIEGKMVEKIVNLPTTSCVFDWCHTPGCPHQRTLNAEKKKSQTSRRRSLSGPKRKDLSMEAISVDVFEKEWKPTIDMVNNSLRMLDDVIVNIDEKNTVVENESIKVSQNPNTREYEVIQSSTKSTDDFNTSNRNVFNIPKMHSIEALKVVEESFEPMDSFFYSPHTTSSISQSPPVAMINTSSIHCSDSDGNAQGRLPLPGKDSSNTNGEAETVRRDIPKSEHVINHEWNYSVNKITKSVSSYELDTNVQFFVPAPVEFSDDTTTPAIGEAVASFNDVSKTEQSSSSRSGVEQNSAVEIHQDNRCYRQQHNLSDSSAHMNTEEATPVNEDNFGDVNEVIPAIVMNKNLERIDVVQEKVVESELKNDIIDEINCFEMKCTFSKIYLCVNDIITSLSYSSHDICTSHFKELLCPLPVTSSSVNRKSGAIRKCVEENSRDEQIRYAAQMYETYFQTAIRQQFYHFIHRKYSDKYVNLIIQKSSFILHKVEVVKSDAMQTSKCVDDTNNIDMCKPTFGFRIHGCQPVIITDVEYGSPAYNSDLQVGDIILKIEGQNVVNQSHLDVVKMAKSYHQSMRLEVCRIPDATEQSSSHLSAILKGCTTPHKLKPSSTMHAEKSGFASFFLIALPKSWRDVVGKVDKDDIESAHLLCSGEDLIYDVDNYQTKFITLHENFLLLVYDVVQTIKKDGELIEITPQKNIEQKSSSAETNHHVEMNDLKLPTFMIDFHEVQEIDKFQISNKYFGLHFIMKANSTAYSPSSLSVESTDLASHQHSSSFIWSTLQDRNDWLSHIIKQVEFSHKHPIQSSWNTILNESMDTLTGKSRMEIISSLKILVYQQPEDVNGTSVQSDITVVYEGEVKFKTEQDNSRETSTFNSYHAMLIEECPVLFLIPWSCNENVRRLLIGGKVWSNGDLAKIETVNGTDSQLEYFKKEEGCSVDGLFSVGFQELYSRMYHKLYIRTNSEACRWMSAIEFVCSKWTSVDQLHKMAFTLENSPFRDEKQHLTSTLSSDTKES